MGTCNRQKIVNISMDIEDIYGDRKILDNILKDLILFLQENNIPCDMYISGIRFSSIRENAGLVQLLHSSNICCGTHTNTHSFTPVSCMESMEQIRYCEENHFYTEKKVFLPGHRSGMLLAEEEFSPVIFRCPGFCWSPNYFRYMTEKNYQFTTIDIKYPKPFQFMGLTVMPIVYKPLEAYENTGELNRDIAGFQAVSVYLHPARLAYDNFWDKKARRSLQSDIPSRICHIKEMFLHLKKNCKLIHLSEIKGYSSVSRTVSVPAEIVAESMISKWTWSQLPAGFFSLEQILQVHKETDSLRGMCYE